MAFRKISIARLRQMISKEQRDTMVLFSAVHLHLSSLSLTFNANAT